jgi:hypothetical protein
MRKFMEIAIPFEDMSLILDILGRSDLTIMSQEERYAYLKLLTLILDSIDNRMFEEKDEA